MDAVILFLENAHVRSEVNDSFYEKIEWLYNELPVYHMKVN